MKFNLKLMAVAAAMLAGTVARAATYDPFTGELHDDTSPANVSYGSAQASNWRAPDSMASAGAPEAGGGSGEPQGASKESEQHAEFLQNIWAMP
jgi:hypothetical protein